MIFNMVGGGGTVGDLTGSTIKVNSDIGVLITITRGKKTQKATIPSSGSVSFTVKSSGRYTVSASLSGKETLLKNVDVLEDDTTYETSMNWEYVLYDNGTQIVPFVTANYNNYTKSAPTFESSYISFAQSQYNNSSSTIALTSNVIDISKYSKLCLEYEITSVSSGGNKYPAIEVTSVNSTIDGSKELLSYGIAYSVGKHTEKASISQVSNGYVGFRFNCTGNGSIAGKVYKIWLES